MQINNIAVRSAHIRPGGSPLFFIMVLWWYDNLSDGTISLWCCGYVVVCDVVARIGCLNFFSWHERLPATFLYGINYCHMNIPRTEE